MIQPCSTKAAVLCVEVGAGLPLRPLQVTGKLAFVSSQASTGAITAGNATGVAAADAFCRSLASANGMTNASKFKAWLSDGTLNAKDRLTSSGPWSRLDGVVIGDRAALTSRLEAPLVVTEQGEYVTPGSVWTGTKRDGTTDATHCGGWTTASAAVQGTAGSPNWASGGWTTISTVPCSQSARLYCFEDD